ncbi:unnamed protein product, partial [Hapterophycus canaliculatus]
RNKRARFGTASPHKSACLGCIDRFAETNGQFIPLLNVTYLYLGCMKELYDIFAEERRLNHEDTISYPYFTKIWKKHRPDVKPKIAGTFMKCDECTRYKATRSGAPGVRAATDAATLAAAEDAHRQHLKLIELDRACLLRDEQRAIEAKRNRDPLRFVSIQADAAAQTAFALPMLSPLTHGIDRGYSERQKIMAVLVEGQFMDIFLTPQNLDGGCNLICTSLHHTFNRLFEKHVPAGKQPFIHHLTIQVDNCVSENKNHILLGYLGSLVGRKIIGSVSVHFMPVGHAHIKIDQAFSRLAVGCKHLDLFTREEQASAFSASHKKLPVHTTTLRNLGNFKAAVLGEVKKIHGISKPRAFQLVRDGEQHVTVGMKEYMHHEAYTGMTRDGVFTGQPHELFIGSVPRVEDAPPFELKPVDETTLVKIQQRYDSVHPRLKLRYPADPAKREHIIGQMNHSVALLGEDGTKDWDLPCFFNRRRDIGDSSDDVNSDDRSDSRRSQNDNASQQSSPLYLEPGCFVVFPLELSNRCSVEVGKIVDIDLTAWNGGEVTGHWYTLARKQKSRRSRYGKGVWSPVFVTEGNRRIPDKGTKPVKSAYFTFRRLLQSGKLPTAVWAAVEDGVPTPSHGEVESAREEEEDGDEEGGEGGGGGAQSE